MDKRTESETVIWRYTNFAKFVALIDARALFFAYAGEFSDRLDGSGSEERAAVSSWHINDHESEAMWRLYSPIEEALAIRSSRERLRRALPEAVLIDKVCYVDAPPEEEQDPVRRLFAKRSAYEHERELRAVCLLGAAKAIPEAQIGDTGIALPVDPGRLIEQVVISPFAAGWFVQLVDRVNRRYGLALPVAQSELRGTVRSP